MNFSKKHRTACTGCDQEFKDKNTAFCTFCHRRTQAANGQKITAQFPTQKMIAIRLRNLQQKHKIGEFQELIKPSKTKVCGNCGQNVSDSSLSGLCRFCYDRSGKTCAMPECDKKLVPRNKSGYCSKCSQIVYNRKRRGIPIHAPIKRRNRKEKELC